MAGLYSFDENHDWLSQFCHDVFRKQNFARLTPDAMREFEERLSAFIGAATLATKPRVRDVIFRLPRAIKGRLHNIKKPKSAVSITSENLTAIRNINDALVNAELSLVEAHRRIPLMKMAICDNSGISSFLRKKLASDLRKTLKEMAATKPYMALSLYYYCRLYFDKRTSLTQRQRESLIENGLNVYGVPLTARIALQWKMLENGLPGGVTRDAFYERFAPEIISLSQRIKPSESDKKTIKTSIYKMMSHFWADSNEALQEAYARTASAIFANKTLSAEDRVEYTRTLLASRMSGNFAGARLLSDLIAKSKAGELTASFSESLLNYLANPNCPVFPKTEIDGVSKAMDMAANIYYTLAEQAHNIMVPALVAQLETNPFDILDKIDSIILAATYSAELAHITPWPAYAHILDNPALKPAMMAQAQAEDFDLDSYADCTEVNATSENAQTIVDTLHSRVRSALPVSAMYKPTPMDGVSALTF